MNRSAEALFSCWCMLLPSCWGLKQCLTQHPLGFRVYPKYFLRPPCRHQQTYMPLGQDCNTEAEAKLPCFRHPTTPPCAQPPCVTRFTALRDCGLMSHADRLAGRARRARAVGASQATAGSVLSACVYIGGKHALSVQRACAWNRSCCLCGKAFIVRVRSTAPVCWQRQSDEG